MLDGRIYRADIIKRTDAYGDCNGGNGIYDHPSEENVGEKRKRCIRRKRAVKSDRRDKDSDRKGKTSGSERRIRNRDRTDRRGRERQASGSRREEC